MSNILHEQCLQSLVYTRGVASGINLWIFWVTCWVSCARYFMLVQQQIKDRS